MYSAFVARLPSITGSQAWPIATSTMARYFALSKNASRFVDVLGVGGAGFAET
ncbi:hypothetical protein M877_28080 [Streptomyces niveus NCIMB 11891]|nr:hypothetical protein M877_28080 [Streptomyces niveus NCIMB 11891]